MDINTEEVVKACHLYQNYKLSQGKEPLLVAQEKPVPWETIVTTSTGVTRSCLQVYEVITPNGHLLQRNR